MNAICHLYFVNGGSITRTISLHPSLVQSDTDLFETAKDGNDEYSTSLLSPSRGSPVTANVPSEGETHLRPSPTHPSNPLAFTAPGKQTSLYPLAGRPTSGRNTKVVGNATFKLIESDNQKKHDS